MLQSKQQFIYFGCWKCGASCWCSFCPVVVPVVGPSTIGYLVATGQDIIGSVTLVKKKNRKINFLVSFNPS